MPKHEISYTEFQVKTRHLYPEHKLERFSQRNYREPQDQL